MNTNGYTADAVSRGDLAEDMLPVAAHLAVLVHGDGGPQDVREVLAKLDDVQKNALIVVLAGMVDPDRPIGAVLGWLDFDEHGGTAAPAWDESDTVRTLAEAPDPQWDPAFIDPAAVDAYLNGRPVKVNKGERLEAIRIALARGLMYPDLDALHNLAEGATSTFISRSRKTFQEWAIPFPPLARPDATLTFTEPEVIGIRHRSAAGATDAEIAMSYGVARETITRLVSGDSYKQFGGPIRPKRENIPSVASRTLWAHTSAQAPALAAAG